MKRSHIYTCAVIAVALFAGCSTTRSVSAGKQSLLHYNDFAHYARYFNNMEDENIAQAVPNAAASEWMRQNIPLFTCPQQNFEEMFYFRWWSFRKHIKETPAGFAFTEFLVERSYADKYNLIACAIGHHINEGRWLHNQQYLNDYLKVWYRGNEGKPMKKLHGFSSWTPDAVYNRYLVNADKQHIIDFYPDLSADFHLWEQEKKLPDGLYWQSDVKDGMEETISGGRREKNARPTINSYMYGNAVALSKMAALAGKENDGDFFRKKADTIRQLVLKNLWHPTQQFFEVRKEKGGLANVKEAIGYIPWYFGLPGKGYEQAWRNIKDTSCFAAPFGLTTADRSHPEFRTHGCCKCEWDGPVWPFATAQTLTAMANLLNEQEQQVVGREDYFMLLQQYVESQYYRGRPYIGEYLDERTGYWLKGDQERSRYYNHSTFNDLLITGLVGLRPRADNMVELNPLIPAGKWDWFCLDNILYHGKILTIIWDKNGEKFGKGPGLSIWVNGVKKGERTELGPLKATM